MATLQVKGIDERLYEGLRRRANRDHRSISQEVVHLIEEHLARPPGTDSGFAVDDFLQLAGTWQDDRPAAEIAADIRSSRRTGRRFATGS